MIRYSIPRDHREMNHCIDCSHRFVDVSNLRVFPITYIRYKTLGGEILDHFMEEYCKEVGLTP